MLSIQEVLRQMQEAVHIGSGVDPMRVGVWMMTIEATMREPVAWWLTGTSCVLRYGPEGVQDHPKWSPLFAIPPDVAKLKEEGDAWGRELVVRNRELTEAQAEIERLKTELPRPPPPPPGRKVRMGWFGEYETKESIKAREDYEAFMRGYRYAYGKEDA